MSDDNKQDDTSGTAKRRPMNWNAVAALIATLVGLVGILIAAYTAWNEHQQTRAQVWPYLQVGESDVLPGYVPSEKGSFETHGGHLVAINRGVGPAIVKSVEVKVNGEPQPDWGHVMNALDLRDFRKVTSSLNHTVIAPGGRVNFLVVYGKKDWLRFRKEFFSEVSIRICYCSTLGECWTRTMGAHSNASEQSSGPCPRLPKTAEFHG